MIRWWALAALPAAQAAMLTVSARHDSGLEGDVPRYGFPWPFTWFSGFSSLHWDVAPLVVGAFQQVPALLGDRHLTWELPPAGATRGLAWAPFSAW